MRRIWNRLFGSECSHSETLIIRSVGVQRTVCEECGHLSFSMAPAMALVVDGPLEDVETELPRAAGL